MKVLVACEFSGVVRDAFLERGHDAWSCDLLPSESTRYGDMKKPGGERFGDLASILPAGHNRHFTGDLFSFGLFSGQLVPFELIIAHPPCTYLTNAGVRWLYKNGRGRKRDLERWEHVVKAASFFRGLLACRIPRRCVENPIMHRYGRDLVGEPHSQVIQPWMFGHEETKATCLWLRGLPPLIPTKIIKPDFKKYPRSVQRNQTTGETVQRRGNGYNPRVHYASPGPERWKERSRTLTGIAAAMAEQWGKL